jgi:hypothetical protein
MQEAATQEAALGFLAEVSGLELWSPNAFHAVLTENKENTILQ